MKNKSYTRTRADKSIIKNPGPYEAIVVNHLDKRYMGGLEVELLKYTEGGNTPERSGQLFHVRYLSPFYGVTSDKGLKLNDNYHNTQKSYGMWMVPPDIGTKVLVIFVEGNANYGYWFGCVQDDFMNFMIPDGKAATSSTTDGTPTELKGKKLPVGEYNKKIETGELVDPTFFKKPYNKDFTCVLENQGLLEDEIRGTTTSSARRETPSMVFGVSTPGPLDKRKNAPRVELGPIGQKADLPFNRLGGSSFVMDDGDERLLRSTHASEGPPFYVNRDANEAGGDETIPQNELIRIRTRTGHQILLHNSEDLIYIGNSRGTAWIELTSDGKIDIYAEDSISVMSNNDINLTAERDFNVEAGRNINLKASARWSDENQYLDNKESGRVQIESLFDTNILVGKNHKLTVKGTSNTLIENECRITTNDNYHFYVKNHLYQRSGGSTHESAGKSWCRTADSDIHDVAVMSHFTKSFNQHVFVENDYKIRINNDSHETVKNTKHVTVEEKEFYTIVSKGDFYTNLEQGSHYTHVKGKIQAKSLDSIHLKGGSLIAGDAAEIHWNSGNSSYDGDTPVLALTSKVAINSAIPVDADYVQALSTIGLPYVIPGVNKPVIYESILMRAPQHEPWGHHENLNPHAFKKEDTDREDPGMLPVNDVIVTPDTFLRGKSNITASQVLSGSSKSGTEFIGTTGDGFVNNEQPVIPPSANEGRLATVKTSTGLTAQVAELFQKNFQDFIDELESTGYEIKRIGGYSKRKSVGSSSWSVHASGGAIDINWPSQIKNGVPNGFFKPRPANAPITDMPANTREIAKKHGLGWGGAWRSIDDAMHFSAHKSEGGAWDFPRNGKIPLGPNDIPQDVIVTVAKPEKSNSYTAPPPEELEPPMPGPQHADGTPNFSTTKETRIV